jgi:hypothetical protein
MARAKHLKTINLEEAGKRLFDKHGERIKILFYTQMNQMAKFKCSFCGYEWETIAGSVITAGCGCDQCTDRKNGDKLFHSLEYVHGVIEGFDCELLSEKYDGYRRPLEILFSCGHIQKSSLATFEHMKKKICTKCKRKKIGDDRRSNPEKIVNLVESYGFIFKEFIGEYKTVGKSYISYYCDKGHITTRSVNAFQRNPFCKECKHIEMILAQTGSKCRLWNGGRSELSGFLAGTVISEWKLKIMNECNFKCLISGGSFDEIHHLYPMHKIIKMALKNIGLDKRKELSMYTEEEIRQLVLEVRKIHETIPGACLKKSIHQLFHHYYGNRNFTPEDFYEFQSKIQSGEIQIPENKK